MLRFRLFVGTALIASIAALPAGTSGGASPVPAARLAGMTAGCGAPQMPSGDRTIHIQVGSTVRTARMHLPRRALGHAAPLVLAFHGAGTSGRFMEGYAGLIAPLDAAGAITLFPDAAGRRWTWDARDATQPPAGDAAFIGLLLDDVESKACVDPHRVSATGVSNGGGFAALLGCVMADRLAGIAIVAGGFAALPPCQPSSPLSVIEIHGTKDQSAPYNGNPRAGGRGAVRPWLTAWARADRCAAGPKRTTFLPRVTKLSWGSCAANTSIVHLAIAGGRHQWPGATPPDPGPSAGFAAGPLVGRVIAGWRR